MRIMLEIAPHYLWFSGDGYNWNPDLDPIFYRCFNNLRPREHMFYLRSLLQTDNPLIAIGSDHACHSREEKMINRFGGLPSTQEMVATILTLAEELSLSEEQIAKLLTYNAADFLFIPVSGEKRLYQLEEKIDDKVYCHGRVVNPWAGSKLLFPAPL